MVTALRVPAVLVAMAVAACSAPSANEAADCAPLHGNDCASGVPREFNCAVEAGAPFTDCRPAKVPSAPGEQIYCCP